MTQQPNRASRLAARQPDGCRPQMMHHRWESLLFLHWRVPAARIQETLPSALTADTFHGDAFIGVIPFFMRDVRPVGLPAVPWLSNFQELNVRTYVHDRLGVPGIWFYSLDCNQPLAVITARMLTGLPYLNAEMAAECDQFIRYSCRREKTPRAAHYAYRGVGAARESDVDSLEFFLLERYYLYAVTGESLVRAQVSHRPYRFREAEVTEFSLLPAQLDGFSEMSGAPMHVCFVDALDVKVYATKKLG